ncbi:MAG: hypothetical protein CVU38_02045 [Chloroflexi bacterium HGW-Chloroflexi-1]|nr:MAG: hypothetical protein CVU38_02045 [Chloroflexi bacterium HGW-Chloroflexi-1]
MSRETRWKSYDDSIAPVPMSDRPEAEDARGAADPKHLLASRARLLIAVFLVITLLVIARLVHWQLFGGASDADATGSQAAKISRGRFVDRSGLLLAADNFVWEIYANPWQFSRSNTASALVPELAQASAAPVADIEAQLAQSHLTVVTLSKDAPEAQCQAVQALQKPELAWCAPRRVRAYPLGPLAAHIVGFTNYSLVGVYGVEASYDPWLRDDLPWTQRLPGKSEPMPDAWQLYLPSPGARDLVLHLDAPLQHLVEKHLAEALSFDEAEAGTIIVMDPRTGGILALANQPSFDPNHYSDVDQETWVNSAVSQIYEPGSVFKLITMAAGLDSGQITPDTVFEDKGYLQIGNRFIRNAELKQYGQLTVRDALAKSVNVVTAQICQDMGAETFYRYVHKFGFGKLTEVDLNFEGYGIVTEPGNPLWSCFDQAANSFGQGISVTTLQMINAVAAIANGGTLLQPQVVKGLIKDGQVYYLPPRVLGYPITPETARTLTEMMVYTIDNSAYPDLAPGYQVAGKSGTAEIPTEQGYTSQDTITSFVGFLPAADPQIVILVKLVKPKRSRWAEHVAVPVFGQVAGDAVRILGIPPDSQKP